MNHIIVDFRPFALEQNIQVYVNGECVRTAKVDIGRITDVCYGFCHEYNIDKIDLCGSTDYLKKFQSELGTKFSENVNIEIHNR